MSCGLWIARAFDVVDNSKAVILFAAQCTVDRHELVLVSMFWNVLRFGTCLLFGKRQCQLLNLAWRLLGHDTSYGLVFASFVTC